MHSIIVFTCIDLDHALRFEYNGSDNIINIVFEEEYVNIPQTITVDEENTFSIINLIQVQEPSPILVGRVKRTH